MTALGHLTDAVLAYLWEVAILPTIWAALIIGALFLVTRRRKPPVR